MLFTFVVLGVGSESAFAQRLGKVQKKSPVKKGVEELPRIMDDPPTPPIYVTPPAEVIGDRPYQPGGGGGIWFPSPVQQPQPGHSDPGNLPGGGGSGGGSGGSGTLPPEPAVVIRSANGCKCEIDHLGPGNPDPKCNGIHLYYMNWVATHTYDAETKNQFVDVCSGGDITTWKITGTLSRFSNCSNVPQEDSRIYFVGDYRTGLTPHQVGANFPTCRQ